LAAKFQDKLFYNSIQFNLNNFISFFEKYLSRSGPMKSAREKGALVLQPPLKEFNSTLSKLNLQKIKSI